MGEVLDNFIFSLSKMGSEEEKSAVETAASFQKGYIDYFRHASDEVKSESTQWGMYALQLNRERLDRKKLTMQVSLKDAKTSHVTTIAQRDGRYTTYTVRRYVKKTNTFLKEGKKIRSYNTDSEFILDVIESLRSQEKYSCPCCGHMDLMENFFEGCSYCGTQFNFEDFKSKVNYIRFQDTAMVKFHALSYVMMHIRGSALCCGGLLAVVFLAGQIILPYIGRMPVQEVQYWIFGTIAAFILGTVFGGVGLFFACILLSLLTVLLIDPIITARYQMDLWRNNQVAGEIRKKDAGFSVEALGTVLNSRMQVLHFANDPSEAAAFVQFDAGQLLPQYEDVVYLNMERYRMKQYRADKNHEYINADVVLQCFRYNGKKIKRCHEKVGIRLKRNVSAVTQVLNEKVYLACPNCGASLSLKNGGKCSYCDGVFDLEKIDWVIDRYRCD